MLQIISDDGYVLRLNDGQTISIEKNNPLFNDPDKLLQDIGYPGKAPINQNNIIFFKYANLIESSKDVFVFPVKLYSGTELFLSGNISYRIGPDDFEFNIEPNLVAINSLIKGVKVTEIRGTDPGVGFTTYAELAAHMKDTCVNPDKYPYYFFPVFNNALNTAIGTVPFQMMNPYDEGTQQFITFLTNHFVDPVYGPGVTDTSTMVCPYYKLNYVLKQLASYFGLTPKGNIFTDPKMKSIAIHTREFIQNTIIDGISQWRDTWNNYMPGMLLSDMMKQLIQRIHMVFDFDLSLSELEMETFRSIYESEAIDITEYIGNVIEQEIPETNGTTVTLKSDEVDNLFKVENNDESTFPPHYKLIAGDGLNAVELDCSTLLIANNLPGKNYPGRTLGIDQELYMGYANSAYEPHFDRSLDLTETRQWPLRLVQWAGYNQMPTGRYYPEAIPLDLDEDDILYYRFLNDSKRLIISAYIPPAVLAGLKTTRKYTFKTPGYNYQEIIIEKIAYDIGVYDQLIPVKIYARTLNFDVRTPVIIQPVNNAVTDEFTNIENGETTIYFRVKGYFDQTLHGINEIDFEVVSIDSSNYVFKNQPVSISTNYKGAGGAVSNVYWISGGINGENFRQAEMRIYQGHPQYLLHSGNKTPFVWNAAGGYYHANMTWLTPFEDYYTIFY